MAIDTPDWGRIEKAETFLTDLIWTVSGALRAEPLALLGANNRPAACR